MKTKTKIHSVDLETCVGERKLTTIKMQICSCKAPGWRTGVLRISLTEKFVIISWDVNIGFRKSSSGALVQRDRSQTIIQF